ncbi:MAG: 16S rRNA (cytidine(1402)-2'-O)-methyltransferase [Alphaproteobacteria bacterium]|nr:MAG: 16S rRNA (cytidine(1402)-2'-O)-methyltransferase [Alphaproteobacteria bacterium]
MEVLSPEKPAPGLYLVATPIGHASDITLRALGLLAAADVLYCEDTRVTSKLLSLYGIRQKLEPYHEHNAARMRPKIAARLERGEVIAMVSDAGTPAISDPGFRLARDMASAGHLVTHCPGPSAALTGLVLSGLATNRFFFCGFLPPKHKARLSDLEEVKTVPATLIFYESPKRLAASLRDMETVLGDRPSAVARELTKKFEEIRKGPLSELASAYEEEGAPKGEVVVVVDAPGESAEQSQEQIRDRLSALLNEVSLKDAVAEVTRESGWKRSDVYDLALGLKKAETL